MDAHIAIIVDMGFTPEAAQDALGRAKGDINLAIDWLLTNCAQGQVIPLSAPIPIPIHVHDSQPINVPPVPAMEMSDVEQHHHIEILKEIASQPPPVPEPSSPSSIQPVEVIPSDDIPSNTLSFWESISVSICYKEPADTPTREEMDHISKLFAKEHIPYRLVDITGNTDLISLIQSYSGGRLLLPKVVHSGLCLGGLEQVSQILVEIRKRVAKHVANGIHMDHTTNMQQTDGGNTMNTGTVDKVFSLFGSFFWSPPPPVSTPPPPTNCVEFTVVKYNNLNRGQKRILRFGMSGYFYRLDPVTLEVKETTPYTAVKKVTATFNSITIEYRNGTLYYYQTGPKIIDCMILLFIAHGSEDLEVKFMEQVQ